MARKLLKRQHYSGSVTFFTHAPGTILSQHSTGSGTCQRREDTINPILSVCWTRPLMWLSWSLSLLNGVNGVERSPETRMRVTTLPRALL